MDIPSELLKDVFSNNRIVYASLPITTGWRYFAWLQNTENSADKEAHYQDVILPNIEAGRVAIAKLRRRLRCTVIDPTQLENIKLDWPQERYYQFWDVIIKEVAREIVFLDGWEFSTGCCHELLSALEAKKAIYNQAHELLSVDQAKKLIDRSQAVYREAGIPNEKLIKICQRLDAYLQ